MSHPISLRDDEYLNNPNDDWTTEQITRKHIERLQNAWKQTSEELSKQVQTSQAWEREANKIMLQLNQYILKDKIQQIKLQFSKIFNIHGENPFSLLVEATNELPMLSSGSLSLGCLIKTGESWIAFSSKSNKEEEMMFKSKNFDTFLKYRSNGNNNDQGFAVMNTLGTILPPIVAEYLLTGNIPSLTAERKVYLDDPRLENPDNIDRYVPKELLVDSLFVKSQMDSVGRCIFVLMNNFQDENPPMNQLTNGESLEATTTKPKISLEEFSQKLNQQNSNLSMDIYTLWNDLFDHLSELMITSTVKLFESRQSQELQLQSKLKDHIMNSLYLTNNTNSNSNNSNQWREILIQIQDILTDEIKQKFNLDLSFYDSMNPQDLPLEYDITVKTEVLISSNLLDYSDEFPVITAEKGILIISNGNTQSENVHSTLEEALHSVIKGALDQKKPIFQSFSKLLSPTIISKLMKKTQSMSSSSMGGYTPPSLATGLDRNNRNMFVESHVYLAIPMFPQESIVNGCYLIQLSFMTDLSNSMEYRDPTLMHPTLNQTMAPVVGVPRLKQSLIQLLTTSLQGEITGLLSNWLIEQNFLPLNLFPNPLQSQILMIESKDTFGNNSNNCYKGFNSSNSIKEIAMLDHLVSIIASTSSSSSSKGIKIIDDEDEEVQTITSYDDLDQMISPNHGPPLSSSLPSRNNNVEDLVFGMNELLQSDWSFILHVTNTNSGALKSLLKSDGGKRVSHANSTPTNSNAMSITLTTNTGLRRTIAWNDLPPSMKADISQILGYKGKIQQQLNGDQFYQQDDYTVVPILNESQTVNNYVILQPNSRASIKDCIPYLDIDTNSLPSLHCLLDHEVGSQVAKISTLLLNNKLLKEREVMLENNRHSDDTNVIIYCGRFWRGIPSFTTVQSTEYHGIQTIGKLFQKAIQLKYMKLKENEAMLTREKHSSRETIDSVIENYVSNLNNLDERIKEAKMEEITSSGNGPSVNFQSNSKSTPNSTIADFRQSFIKLSNQFLQELFSVACERKDIYWNEMQSSVQSIQQVEFVVLEGSEASMVSMSPKEWTLLMDDWSWSLSDLDQPRPTKLKSMRSKRKMKSKPSLKRADRSDLSSIGGSFSEYGGSFAPGTSFNLNGNNAGGVNIGGPLGSNGNIRENILIFHEQEEHQDHNNIRVQGNTAKIHMYLRIQYTFSANRAAQFDSTTLLQALPGQYIWVQALRQFLNNHIDIILHCPANQTMKQYRELMSSKTYTNLALFTLSTTMLSSTRFLTRSVPHSLSKPYHLHDYLHNSHLLHRIYTNYPFQDYIILPITKWNSKLGRIHMEDFSTDDDDSSEELEGDDFVHLLHLDEEALQDARLQFLQDQTLNLPTKLSRYIRLIHRYIEANGVMHSHSSSTASIHRQKSYDTDPGNDFASLAEFSRIKRKPKKKSDYKFHESWQSYTKGSVLSTLPEMGKVLYNYLNELDIQLEGKLCRLMLGKEYEQYMGLNPMNNPLDEDLGSDGESEAGMIDYLINNDCKVLMYSPFYPANVEAGETEEEFGKSRTVRNNWSTHYLLICRKDRLTTPTSYLNIQEKLDEIFAPSQVISSGQPWFECVSGMERLLLAATSNDFNFIQHDTEWKIQLEKEITSASLDASNISASKMLASPGRRQLATEFERPQRRSSLTNAYMDTTTIYRGRSILSECMSILKSSIGSRYMASVGYLLVPNKDKLINYSTHSDPNQATINILNDKVELLRCCSDSNNGNSQRWELGPSKMYCPATSTMIMSRFTKRSQVNNQFQGDHKFNHFQYQFQDHHKVGSKFSTSRASTIINNNTAMNANSNYTTAGDGNTNNDNPNAPQIHYIEMTSAQLNELLLESNENNNNMSANSYGPSSTSHGISDAIGATGILLRTDVRVLQIFITSNFSSSEDDEIVSSDSDLVVASLLVYISTGNNNITSTGKEPTNERVSEPQGLEKKVSFSQLNNNNTLNRLGLQFQNNIKQVMSKGLSGLSTSDNHTYNNISSSMIQNTIGRGLMIGVMRVIDITGSLISSLYQRKRAELIYDLQIGEELTYVKSERDFLSDNITKITSLLTSQSLNKSSEFTPFNFANITNTYDYYFLLKASEHPELMSFVSERTQAIQVVSNALNDQLYRYFVLRQQYDTLKSSYDHIVNVNNEVILDRQYYSQYLHTFVEAVQKITSLQLMATSSNTSTAGSSLEKIFSGGSSSTTNTASSASANNNSAHLQPIKPLAMINSLLMMAASYATLRKTLSILCQAGLYQEISSFSQRISSKLHEFSLLYNLGMNNENTMSIEQRERINFNSICDDILTFNDRMTTTIGVVTPEQEEEQIKSSHVDLSLVWCQGNSNVNLESLHFIEDSTLLPTKMIQAIASQKPIAVEGNEVNFLLPNSHPYLQYIASKTAVIERIYYVPFPIQTPNASSNTTKSRRGSGVSSDGSIDSFQTNPIPSRHQSQTEVKRKDSTSSTPGSNNSTTNAQSTSSSNDKITFCVLQCVVFNNHLNHNTLIQQATNDLTISSNQIKNLASYFYLNTILQSITKYLSMESLNRVTLAVSNDSTLPPPKSNSTLTLPPPVPAKTLTALSPWNSLLTYLKTFGQNTFSSAASKNSDKSSSQAMTFTRPTSLDNVFNDQFCLQIAEYSSLLLRCAVNFFVVNDPHDFNQVLRGISLASAYNGLRINSHNLSNPKSLAKLRQIINESQNSKDSIYVTTAEYAFISNNNVELCYPKWYLITKTMLSTAQSNSIDGFDSIPVIGYMVVEMDRVPIHKDKEIIRCVLQLLAMTVQHYEHDDIHHRQQLELRTMSNTLADTSMQLMNKQQQLNTLLHTWDHFNLIYPTSLSSYSSASSSSLSKLNIQDISKMFASHLTKIQAWLCNNKELNYLFGVNMVAKLVPISMNEVFRINQTLQTSSTFDSNNYEMNSTTSNFLYNQWSIQHASAYLGSKHLDMLLSALPEHIPKSESILHILGALALHTSALIVDDLRQSTVLIVPVALSQGGSLNLSPDRRGNNEEKGQDSQDLLKANWALILEFPDQKTRTEFLSYLASSGPTTTSSSKSDPNSDSMDLISSEDSSIAYTPNIQRQLLTNLALTLRQWLLWHQSHTDTTVQTIETHVGKEIMEVFFATSDALHDLETLLSHAIDHLNEDDKFFRLENITALIAYQIQDHFINYLRENNNINQEELGIDISGCCVHYKGVDTANPTAKPTWKTCKIRRYAVDSPTKFSASNKKETSSSAETNNYFTFSEKEQELLMFSQQCEWEIVDSSISDADIAACLSSESGTVILPPVTTTDNRSVIVRIGNIASTISYVIELQLRIKDSHEYVSSFNYEKLMALTQQSMPLLISVRNTVDHMFVQHSLALQYKEVNGQWNDKIAQIESRQQFLTDCMQLFTAEGSNPVSVLQRFQQLLYQLPGIQQSYIICQDTMSNKTLFEETQSYSSDNQPRIAPLTPISPGPGLFSPSTKGHNVTFGSLASPGINTPNGPSTPGILKDAKGLSLSLQSPPVKKGAKSAVFFADSSIINNESWNVVQLETAFECYEIQGKFVISICLSDSFLAPQLSKASKKSSVAMDTQAQDILEKRQSIERLLLTIGRTLGRRVFELHRGYKNKQLLAVKQQELHKKSSELVEKNQLMNSLEQNNTLTLHELTNTAAETERVRTLLTQETKYLKETLAQKKESIGQFKQALNESKREYDRKEALYLRQIRELRDQYNVLQKDLTKSKEELSKLQQKEQSLLVNKHELTKQIQDLQRSYSEAEATIRHLKSDLMSIQAHEQTLVETGDTKLKSFLQRIKLLEDELQNARGTNNFLKKQLETTTQNLKSAQEEHTRQLHIMQTSMLIQSNNNNTNNLPVSSSNPSSRSVSPTPTTSRKTLSRLNSASGSFYLNNNNTNPANNNNNNNNNTVFEILLNEQKRADELKQRIVELERERTNTVFTPTPPSSSDFNTPNNNNNNNTNNNNPFNFTS